MKKIIPILITALLLFSAVGAAGCNGDVKYDITYASWNLSTESINNIERRMIKAFEQETGYRVKIDESVSSAAYEDSIKILAGKNKLPDVFMLTNINFGLSNEYLLNIKSYAGADADWANIPATSRDAVYYGSGIYAVPFAVHMMGYFINVSLFEDKMVNELDIFPEYDDFLAAVSSFYDKRNEGVFGLSHETTVLDWYPASVNENLGWFTWDGEKYNLDSPAFSEAMAKTKELYTNQYTYDSLTDAQRADLFPGIEGHVALWNANKLGIRWGATYEIPDMLEKCGFPIKFIGVPGGRVPVASDYLGISPVSQNPDVAYEFAKWMSFDPAGIAKRMELDAGNEFNTLPVSTDTQIIDAYFNKNNGVAGYKEVFAQIDNGIVESVKVVPGYRKSRWDAATGVPVPSADLTNAKIGELIDLCWRGSLSFADYAAQLNTLANSQYSAAVAEYAAKYS